MQNHIKVWFDLEEDWHGYGTETVWAIKNSEVEAVLDNIPFFARGVSCGDVVKVEKIDEGSYKFIRRLKWSGHSTIRVMPIPGHEEVVAAQIQALVKVGCIVESMAKPPLYAIDVPTPLLIESVTVRLRELEEDGVLEYEEGNIEQSR